MQIALRGVDHRQALLQLGKAFVRRTGLFGHRLADPPGHGVQPLAERLVELGLARTQRLVHLAHPALHLDLLAHDLGHAHLGVAGMLRGFRRGGRACARRPPQGDCKEDDQQDDNAAGGDKGLTQRDNRCPELKNRLVEQGGEFVHLVSLCDLAAHVRSKREQRYCRC